MKNIFYNPDNIDSINPDSIEYIYSMADSNHATLEDEKAPKNNILYIILTVVFIILTATRLFFLQIISGTKNLFLAEGNRVNAKNIKAPRGIIYDYKYRPLVKNVSNSVLALYPQELSKNPDEKNKTLKFIRENLKIEIPKITQEAIVLKENLTHEETIALKILTHDYSGIYIEETPIRQYENIDSMGYILGYIGKVSEKELKNDQHLKMDDMVGKSGVEKTYNQWLTGIDGQSEIEVNSNGQFQRLIAQKPPEIGAEVKLSIDLDLQNKAGEILKNTISQSNYPSGVVIGMNPQTGKILFMNSVPNYDPNTPISSLLNNASNPLINRAISGIYPSGSVIKPVIASAALQEKVVSPDYKIDTPAEIKIGQYTFPDWKDHGVTDIRRAIAESNNIFFYALGGGWDKIKGLGINRLDQYLEKFGFGNPTNIDLTGEVSGSVPSPEWKKKVKHESWYIGDTYHLSIGQGDLIITPMQMLNAISSIANNGTLYQPRVVDEIRFSDGNVLKIESKINNKNIISPGNLQIVREGMRLAVTDGSARLISGIKDKNGNIVESAAKTGTAQVTTDKFHAWFTVFAPYDNPQIAIVVLIEEGGEGYLTAGPIAKSILEFYFQNY
ncbi:MAG: penicillin-binding protein 2 [Candidatus Berkelbacteria bacterium Licking1014_85]|uniref:Penicillin-binding protein 2 n=1 Tax=Candidatus Berkelbacteria bacterium Licking1014_85 TaxID=2017148 RepID=A0A554LKC6_9BACT|nr:MAG: penicillin-binding protein 2 [Candidatus Berkelbacteria bacterium Licking1014_85]